MDYAAHARIAELDTKLISAEASIRYRDDRIVVLTAQLDMEKKETQRLNDQIQAMRDEQSADYWERYYAAKEGL